MATEKQIEYRMGRLGVEAVERTSGRYHRACPGRQSLSQAGAAKPACAWRQTHKIGWNRSHRGVRKSPERPDMISMTINGRGQEFSGDGAMPLLWYLRDELGLTGTKFGCGVSACGACTVHLDGQAVRACVTPVSAAEGKKVVTIEGLSRDGSHPVQRAWREHNVPQCGYCQTGQIMQAAALLAATPRPSDAEIDRAMAGNICRCGTYIRIRTAIHAAAGKDRS